VIFQINKSSNDFWNNLKLTWQQCADLPVKRWGTSVAELDGKVYVSTLDSRYGYCDSLVYDSSKDQWSTLPALPCAHFSLVTVPDRKQVLAIGGIMNNKEVIEFSSKVFLWDENNRKWITPYPNMPTARSRCTSISHGSMVIVIGGETFRNPRKLTRAVEVLHIEGHSHWSIIEQLPLAVFEAIPLIVNDKLCVAVGYDTPNTVTCDILTASLPELLQSSNNNTSSSHVWNKLPDMTYSSWSINHYQGHLITFGGGHRVEQPDQEKPVWESVSLMHVYNPHTKTWDYVGDIPHGYLLGRSIHIRENKILFIGGTIGTHNLSENDDDITTTCSTLTLSPR